MFGVEFKPCDCGWCRCDGCQACGRCCRDAVYSGERRSEGRYIADCPSGMVVSASGKNLVVLIMV